MVNVSFLSMIHPKSKLGLSGWPFGWHLPEVPWHWTVGWISIFPKKCCALPSLGLSDSDSIVPNQQPEQQLGTDIPVSSLLTNCTEIDSHFFNKSLLVVYSDKVLHAAPVADKTSVCPRHPSPSSHVRRWSSNTFKKAIYRGLSKWCLPRWETYTNTGGCSSLRWQLCHKPAERAKQGLWQFHRSTA